mmetsp:Transcript_12096/g.23038  ORF Transcript_12096/g.23038 Transcript_12096/m.23038 type:complete len:1195 (+) Transcript_12096:267-3851(+)|eukprot:CAMPEP_0201683458 /NCGR_PEP_ID=MMETSP0494-20130426/52138_1 /ASSEMBLY_ACC=CAM_ASM_000839 /TAXON_ID=420259 /ORGANISM="Thalassiosira gravida, Strain GMp14c1" /LENGTH=1194 /DNA_ID=CAMNT_0048167237 /DNA_START=318 /DNA_END=3902 /DNA_ORIENTATION=+
MTYNSTMKLHKKKKNKKTKNNGIATASSSFHPPIMFCGECCTCAAPPPPISNASFTTMISDEESQIHELEHIHLRIYNARTTTSNTRTNESSGHQNQKQNNEDNDGDDATTMERVDILKTILTELDGVKDVIISKSHLPSRTEYEDDTTAENNVELVDPTSCMIKVEYYDSSSSSSSTTTTIATTTTIMAVTDNPQEPKEDKTDSIRQAILTRLTNAGFDYAVNSNDANTNSTPTTNYSKPNNDDNNAMSSSLLNPLTTTSQNHHQTTNTTNNAILHEPPPSCRTRLRVQGICCSSEVPAVRSILRPLPGVRKVGINIATKVVFIDHDPSIISANLLAGALNEEKFGADVLTDGGLELLVRKKDGGSVSAEGGAGSSKKEEKGKASPNDILDLPRSRFVESTFFVPGMIIMYANDNERRKSSSSSSCPIGKLVRQNFFKDHLRAFHLHAPSRTLKVEHDPELLSAEKVMDVLTRGLEKEDWGSIELAHDGAVEGLQLPVLTSDNQMDGEDMLMDGEEKCFQGLKINVIVSGIFWILSLLSFVGGSWSHLQYAGIGSVLSGMPPVIMKAWMTIRRMQFDANCMMIIAAFGALALGEFDEAASVSFFFAVSEWLEARATGKARRALGEIISLRPEYANVVDPESGGIVIVPAANVPVGSVVSVRTGDKAPADGVVVEGTSSVDESSLTGEARPVDKRAGDDVSGGSINVGVCQLVVKTTATVGDSTLSRLIQLVEEAQANTSETEKLVDAFARKYTPVVLTMSLFICTVPWFFGAETGRYWMLNGLIIMVIACPCALTISTPVTYSAGLAAAAQRGIIIKGGSKLEALGNVKTVLFDKTGTITTGRFALSRLDLVGNLKSRKELLELLAIIEAPSSHPLSACLVSAAREEGVVVPPGVDLREHTILKGEGVTAYVDGERVYVGNGRLFKRLDMYNISPQQMESAEKWSEEGATVGYIGIEGFGIIGMFCVKDKIRDEAYSTVQALLHSGIEVAMLTGDGEGAAQAVAKEIGLAQANVQSQLLPEDKLHYISSLKGSSDNRHTSLLGKKKLTLMVGDGVNDAPALSVADVGVAMGEGASLAMEMSDVTLMDSNLSKLLFSIKMGVKVIKTVKENIAFSMLVNLIAIVLTFMGKMTLLWAIVSDVGVMLLVTLNGMKLLSNRTIDSIEGKRTKKPASKRKNGQKYSISPTVDHEQEIV